MFRLAEFDNIASVSTDDLRQRPRMSWRIAYHPVAMHWLDILSCHMRRQVNEVVNVEYEWSRTLATAGQTCHQKEVEKSNSSSPSQVTSTNRASSDEDIRQSQSNINKFEDSDQTPGACCSFRVNTLREPEQSVHRPGTLQSSANASHHITSTPESSFSTTSEGSSSEYDSHCSSGMRHADCLPRLILVDENFNPRSSSTETLTPDTEETYLHANTDSKTAITTSLADFTSIMTR